MEVVFLDYIVLNPHYFNKFNIDTLSTTNKTGNYKVIGNEGELTIFELNNNIE